LKDCSAIYEKYFIFIFDRLLEFRAKKPNGLRFSHAAKCSGIRCKGLWGRALLR